MAMFGEVCSLEACLMTNGTEVSLSQWMMIKNKKIFLSFQCVAVRGVIIYGAHSVSVERLAYTLAIQSSNTTPSNLVGRS